LSPDDTVPLVIESAVAPNWTGVPTAPLTDAVAEADPGVGPRIHLALATPFASVVLDEMLKLPLVVLHPIAMPALGAPSSVTFTRSGNGRGSWTIPVWPAPETIERTSRPAVERACARNVTLAADSPETDAVADAGPTDDPSVQTAVATPCSSETLEGMARLPLVVDQSIVVPATGRESCDTWTRSGTGSVVPANPDWSSPATIEMTTAPGPGPGPADSEQPSRRAAPVREPTSRLRAIMAHLIANG